MKLMRLLDFWIWMIRKTSIYLFSCVFLCALTGSLFLCLWKCLSKSMEKQGFIRMNCLLLKSVFVFFILPIACVVLKIVRFDDGLTFEFTRPWARITYLINTIWILGVCYKKVKRGGISNFKILKENTYECEDWMVALLEKYRNKVRIKKQIEIQYCNLIPGPLVYRLKNPKILMPDRVYTKDELEVILLHECMHIKHHDIFWKYLCNVITYLYWFLPYIKEIPDMLDEWQETYVDYSVCEILNDNQRYFTTIIEMGVLDFDFGSCICSGIYENMEILKKRILRFKKVEKMNKMKWSLATILFASFIFGQVISVSATSYGYWRAYLVILDYTEEAVCVDDESPELVIQERKIYTDKKSNEKKKIRILSPKEKDSNFYFLVVDLKSGERMQTKERKLKKGDKIVINAGPDAEDPNEKEECFRFGIIDSKGESHLIISTTVLLHELEIKEDGYYKIFVQNDYDHFIRMCGYINIEKENKNEKNQ